MNTLSSRPSEVGVYKGETDTNLRSNGQNGTHKKHAVRLLLVDGAKKAETRSNLLFWSIRFHDGADYGDVDVLGANIMCGRHHSNVDVSYAKVRRCTEMSRRRKAYHFAC